MPHISTRRLNDRQLRQLQQNLIHLLSEAGKHKRGRQFLDSILTHTEKIMLGKRVSAVILFAEGYAPYAAGKVLGISPSTVARLHARYEMGGFGPIVAEWKKNDPNFLNFLELILSAGLPPRGRGRWRMLKGHN